MKTGSVDSRVVRTLSVRSIRYRSRRDRLAGASLHLKYSARVHQPFCTAIKIAYNQLIELRDSTIDVKSAGSCAVISRSSSFPPKLEQLP
jgi:hypothetical protein